MSFAPIKIERLGKNGIFIKWSDGVEQSISSLTLRENCPSASSKAKRGDTSHSKPLSGKSLSLKVVSSTLEEETSLEKIWSIGNYAIGMRWADGHDSGIYTYEFLRELGNKESL